VKGRKNMIKVEQYKDEYYQFWQIKCDDLELLRFVRSSEDDNKWIWISQEMNVEDDYVVAESFDGAVDLLRDKIVDFYNEKLEKYETIVNEVDRYIPIKE